MATITVTLPEGTTACSGKQVTFRAPCDCTGVTGIIIGDTTYELVDAVGVNISNIGVVFTSGSMVSVILDTENLKAYIQNSANEKVLENFLISATNTEGSYSVDKTYQEIVDAISTGKFVYLKDESGSTYLLNSYSVDSSSVEFKITYSSTTKTMCITSDNTVTFSESVTTPIVYSENAPETPEPGVIYAIPI